METFLGKFTIHDEIRIAANLNKVLLGETTIQMERLPRVLEIDRALCFCPLKKFEKGKVEMKIPELASDIHKMFVQVLAGDVPLLDFEKWIYQESRLEEALPKNTYLCLLEFDYQKKSTFYELSKLLSEWVEPGTVEAYEMLKLIERLEAEGADFPEALQDCYDLYTDGCYFLESLGLNWGLMLRCPPAQFHADDWIDLSISEKALLLGTINLDQVRKEVSQFRRWIENREIIAIKRPNECPRYEFIDLRSQGVRS